MKAKNKTFTTAQIRRAYSRVVTCWKAGDVVSGKPLGSRMHEVYWPDLLEKLNEIHENQEHKKRIKAKSRDEKC